MGTCDPSWFLAGSLPSEDGDVGVYAKMMWLARTVRGVVLVALVIAVVVTTNYLMSTTRSAPGAAVPSDVSAAEVVDESSAAATADADGIVADEPTADHPTDLSSDLIDADTAAPPAADSNPTLDPSQLDPSAIAQPSELDPSAIVQAVTGTVPEQSADPSSQGAYTRTVVANLAYGSGAANVGLSSGSGKRPVGPSSFAVDSMGAFYVSDNVNSRVQVFTSQGNPARSLQVDSYVYDLTTGDANDLYLLDVDGGLTVQDVTTGQVKAKGATTEALAQQLGVLRVVNGQLSLESPEQVAYPLGKSQSGGMALLSSQEQTLGQAEGAATGSQSRYTTSYLDGGHVYRLDDKGNKVQDIALGIKDVATVVFLQEDRAGNVYVQVERASDNGQVSVEVRQLSKKGELIAAVSIDRVDYVPMTKSTVVDDDGTIYQLVPTAQGVALVKDQRS